MSTEPQPAKPAPDMSQILASRARASQHGTARANAAAVTPMFDDDDTAERTAELDDAEEYLPPARTVGRAGRGMANAVFYMTAASQAALNQFADDAFFSSRGRIRRWEAIEAVLRPAMTPAALARAQKRLGLPPQETGR